jgi:hypothetical protein
MNSTRAGRTPRQCKKPEPAAAEIAGFPKFKRNKLGNIVPGSVRATGKNGLIGYLTFIALNEPVAYLGFLGRLLPLQVNAHFDGQVDHNRELTPEELREELRRRSLPEHVLGVDRPQLEYPEATQG